VIKKRGAVWWLDLWCGPKRIRRSLHTDERALAIERARDLTLELRKPKPPGTPFAEFSEKYKDWARTAKPASYKTEAYRIAIIKSWLEAQNLLTLEQISTHAVEELRAFVLAKRIGHTDKTVGRSSVNRYCALVRTMFNKATDWGTFSGTNPVSKVKFYRESGKVRPLDNSEIERILAEADALATRKHATPLQREAPALFRFILNTGLRRSEALNLRWNDVGDDAITVKGKGGKTRTVPLNAEARGILAKQRKSGIVSGYIFNIPGRNSQSLLRRLTATLAKNAGVPFHLHLLRHAFATRLLQNSVDIVTIGELLGHSAAFTTMIYAHSNPTRHRAAVDALTGQRQVDVNLKRRLSRRK
jgi:integrase